MKKTANWINQRVPKFAVSAHLAKIKRVIGVLFSKAETANEQANMRDLRVLAQAFLGCAGKKQGRLARLLPSAPTVTRLAQNMD
jgi:hypothetical protein